MAGEDFGVGGQQTTGLGGVFQGGSAGGFYMGAAPPHGGVPGKILAQVCQTYYG